MSRAKRDGPGCLDRFFRIDELASTRTLLKVVDYPADVQDRDGAAYQLLRRVRQLFPFINRIFADGG